MPLDLATNLALQGSKLFLIFSFPEKLEEKKQMIADKRSSMDIFLSDLKSVNRIVNQADKDKLNEYLQSVREIEQRLTKEESWIHRPKPKAPFQKPQNSRTNMNVFNNLQKTFTQNNHQPSQNTNISQNIIN